MVSLLIDYSNIILPNNLVLLENRIAPIPETKYSLGIVLVIPRDQYNALESIPKGDTRVQYLNTVMFVNSITGYAYLIYDKQKRVCEIMGIHGPIISNVLDSALSSIPNDVTLWIGIDLTNTFFDILISEYIKEGFSDPYICKVSPLGFTFTTYGLCMLKQNNIINYNALNDVKYVLTQFLNRSRGYCTLRACLSDDTAQYLQKVSTMGSTHNSDGVITQKEIAGRLLTGYINSDLSFELDIDKDSIIWGDEEGVDVIVGLFNFHSHPKEAYDRHNVSLGWPSGQDYIGFWVSAMNHETILHIVASIEGFYVISMSEYWAKNKKSLPPTVDTFIGQEYDIRYQNGHNHTIEWYIKKVNSIPYLGYPLFLVQFFSWYDVKQFFTVPYYRVGENCFARQTTCDKYLSLYK